MPGHCPASAFSIDGHRGAERRVLADRPQGGSHLLLRDPQAREEHQREEQQTADGRRHALTGSDSGDQDPE